VILVTDPRWSDERILEVARAAASPAFAVQLRDRSERSDDALVALALELRDVTARAGALLIVNRRAELARRVAADGYHGPDVTSGFPWRSVPTHDDRDVERARDSNATAVFVSPVFDVPDKRPARGLDAVRRAREIAPTLTIVALGGINTTNASACFDAGADAVAVMRALLDAPHPEVVAKCLAPTPPRASAT
jgi:thiamine-phosphate pyrophosphorylase